MLLLQAKMGDCLKDIFTGGNITPDPEVDNTASVYEVEYKGKKFLISNNFEYIPIVEPENTGDWEFNNNGTIIKYIGTDTDVTIPNYINGIRMNKIGSRIFINKTIKKLTISNGIEEIESLTFQYGLNELEGDLIIPDSITYLPSEAFRNCGATGNLKISKNLKNIGTNAFGGCSNLKGDLIIPDSVEEIGSNAFYGCSSLDGVQFGNSVKIIGDRFFRLCSSLTGDLILPDSIEEIGWQAFNGDSLLNGNLYIGNNIKIINSEAFLNSGNLKGDLIIGRSAETIGSSAFGNCNSISSITFLKNDTEINSVPPNAVIKGYTNSTAQAYAQAKGKTFVPLD